MPISLRLAALALVFAPAVVAQQGAPEVLDLPLDTATRDLVVGTYLVSPPGSDAQTMEMRLFLDDGRLMGAMDGNEATPMLFQGAQTFRPEAAPVFLLTFTEGPDGAVGVVIDSPEGSAGGTRVAAPEADLAVSGPLFDALEAADRALFDAIFVACDPDAAAAFLDPDVEFYHDKVGASAGEDVIASIRRQAEGCPRENGVSREVVPGSLLVSPIPGFGAVQTGAHRFIEPGGGGPARFVHLWRETPEGWRISRVISYDHRAGE